MFFRYRRGWFLCLVALLAVPLITGVVFPNTMRSPDELRPPAEAPAMPRGWLEWITFPARVDPWLRDNFGLRRHMIHAQALVAHWLLASGNDSVLIGKRWQLFYRAEGAVEQSAGHLIRADQVRQTADLVRQVDTILAARGIGFIFGVPPNGSTIYDDLLPRWARRGDRTTEYDLLMTELRERGVRTLDMRPSLRAARQAGRVYFRYDTHWNPAGSLAGYNAVVAAMGRESWRVDRPTIFGPTTRRSGSDLSRLLGLGADLSEPVRYLTIPMPQGETLPGNPPFPPPFVTTSDRVEGPTIMIIGDSFSNVEILMLTAQNARRVVWLHHEGCHFDWKWIDQFQPDEIWWLPVERAMLCWTDRRPRNMPEAPAAPPSPR
ncbi:hypothetical protein GXW78_14310 [Roseomonas terrae]|jgi:alginate O-acetyltransferase complex protein AlgJ|uniref:AlgX/AlgJ SGNH hydrolase-like domain-containing protein n=1 Tax=Neoroseomonas terrae TaxID=424799 RepID=A0ABS5EII3_9PROT|nr:hypothetical protein [Neoroseomonas terrae]MBR0650842.1 hypothetical protein [Neoroseomonas terrae]